MLVSYVRLISVRLNFERHAGKLFEVERLYSWHVCRCTVLIASYKAESCDLNVHELRLGDTPANTLNILRGRLVF